MNIGFLVVVLLLLPAVAVLRSPLDLVGVVVYAVSISALAYWLYGHDKLRAISREWRLPEARLLLVDLLGGWPGGLLAQHRFRHKCSKGSYQFTFWLIVLAWQFAAFDSLFDWTWSKAGIAWVASHQEARHRQ